MPSVAGLKNRLFSALKFGRHDHRKVFVRIFKDRHWGDEESVSGIGSRFIQTEHIRRELPILLRNYDIKKLFDAPCGDLNWMKAVLLQTKIDYLGGDIVPQVVERARLNSPDPAFGFNVFDIVNDRFPTADLWMCRDVLFHLSYANIWKTLGNFSRSEIEFMLVTTHTEQDLVNRDIWTGDFRLLDLLKPPFSFPAEMVLHRFPDYAKPLPPRDMILIRRADLAKHLATVQSSG